MVVNREMAASCGIDELGFERGAVGESHFINFLQDKNGLDLVGYGN